MTTLRAAALAALAIFISVAATVPALAQNSPLPPPRTRTFRSRIVAFRPRVVSIAPKQSTNNTSTTYTVSADVLFAFDSSTLSPNAQSVLAGVVHKLQSAKPGTVSIVGYTDSIGDPEYNVGLSQRRAASVQSYLQGNVSNAVLTYQAQGLGEANPVAPNKNPDGSDNPAGRQQNRRVIITYKVS